MRCVSLVWQKVESRFKGGSKSETNSDVVVQGVIVLDYENFIGLERLKNRSHFYIYIVFCKHQSLLPWLSSETCKHIPSTLDRVMSGLFRGSRQALSKFHTRYVWGRDGATVYIHPRRLQAASGICVMCNDVGRSARE